MDRHLFKCLVGSRAHGLNDPDSDYDYRGVFVVPTAEILRIGAKPKATHRTEGEADDASWEVGHFLRLAAKCNPTVLEAFCAPRAHSMENAAGSVDQGARIWGDRLRGLFPKVWNARGVYDAFRGYSMDQRKKFLEGRDGRPRKFATAWVRTLWQGCVLLRTGQLPVSLEKFPAMRRRLLSIRRGELSEGELIAAAEYWESEITRSYEANPSKATDLEAVNGLLLEIRKEFWD